MILRSSVRQRNERNRMRWGQSNNKNVSEETRSLILKVGYQLQGAIIAKRELRFDAEPKVKYTEIQRKIGTDHYENHDKLIDIRTIKLWWDRRHIFEKTGQIKHTPRSGRPQLQHEAFATPQQKQAINDYPRVCREVIRRYL